MAANQTWNRKSYCTRAKNVRHKIYNNVAYRGNSITEITFLDFPEAKLAHTLQAQYRGNKAGYAKQIL